MIQAFIRPGIGASLAVLAAAAALSVAIPARADDPGWPREFDSSNGSFVIYQPRPEDLEGDLLTGRTVFSLKKSGDAHPIFGVLWSTGRIAVDRDSLTVTPGDLEREYRARRRSGEGETSGSPPPSANPTPPTQRPQDQQSQESPKEKAQERSKDNGRSERKR